MRRAQSTTTAWGAIAHQGKLVERTEPYHQSPKQFLLHHESGIYSAARTISHRVFDLHDHIVRLVSGTLRSQGAASTDPTSTGFQTMQACVEDAMVINLREAMGAFRQHDAQMEMRLYLLLNKPSCPLAEATPTQLQENSYVYVQELPVVTQSMVAVQVRRYTREDPDVKSLDWMRAKKTLEDELPEGLEEALLAGGADHQELYEGLSSNFFAVVQGAVWVAPEGTILLGTVMRLVLDACEALSIPVERKVPSLAGLDQWDGCFITSTSRLVLPISSVTFPDHPELSEKTFSTPCSAISDIQQYVNTELVNRSVDVLGIDNH